MNGKFVLISGASRGIGRAIAVSYARAGAAGIAIIGRSREGLRETQIAMDEASRQADSATPQIELIVADLSSLPAVENVKKCVLKAFAGRLDILINNAAYLEHWKPIAESEPSDWWKTFEINVFGLYLMCRAFIPVLIDDIRSDRTIIQISSAGAFVTSQGGSSYQSTKTWVLRFNDHIQAEYGDAGVIAYSIHPGGVKTMLSTRMPKALHATLVDTPELCGDSIVWLTRERREWLANRYINVQWDMMQLLGKRAEIEGNDLLKMKLDV